MTVECYSVTLRARGEPAVIMFRAERATMLRWFSVPAIRRALTALLRAENQRQRAPWRRGVWARG